MSAREVRLCIRCNRTHQFNERGWCPALESDDNSPSWNVCPACSTDDEKLFHDLSYWQTDARSLIERGYSDAKDHSYSEQLLWEVVVGEIVDAWEKCTGRSVADWQGKGSTP